MPSQSTLPGKEREERNVQFVSNRYRCEYRLRARSSEPSQLARVCQDAPWLYEDPTILREDICGTHPRLPNRSDFSKRMGKRCPGVRERPLQEVPVYHRNRAVRHVGRRGRARTDVHLQRRPR